MIEERTQIRWLIKCNTCWRKIVLPGRYWPFAKIAAAEKGWLIEPRRNVCPECKKEAGKHGQ